VGHSTLLWFARLERARLTFDRVLERRACQALARSGITVIYGGGHPTYPLCITQDDLEQIAARVAEVLRGMTS
jgi:hypothetical protein